MLLRALVILLHYQSTISYGFEADIGSYSRLNYPTSILLNQQTRNRVRRSLSESNSLKSHQEDAFQLDFAALGTNFELRLFEDQQLFSKKFHLKTNEASLSLKDLRNSVIFLRGHLRGNEKNSTVYGYTRGGVFEGRIITHKSYLIRSHSKLSTDFLSSTLSPDYSSSEKSYHSIIYDEDSVTGLPPMTTGCAYSGETERWMSSQSSRHSVNYHTHEPTEFTRKSVIEDLQNRIRRTPSGSFVHEKNTCHLSIISDHKFTAGFADKSAVAAEIGLFVKALNEIFEKIVFDDGSSGYGFAIAKITVEDESSLMRADYKYKDDNIGVEKLLDLVSSEDHSEYCLAYLFTARDFLQGVLGLAWVAGGDTAGGICEKYEPHQNGQRKSLNTGVITTINYDYPVQDRVSHLTFTHEVGHNWGSPHDVPKECQPDGDQGKYIMFASATTGEKPNNSKFSSCSVANMTLVVKKRRDICFKEEGRAICGNMVVDQGEVCDCGFSANCQESGDSCCNPAGERDAQGNDIGCTLKTGATCSPSQGPCCGDSCLVVAQDTRRCHPGTECISETFCDGSSVKCVEQKKPDLTQCNHDTQVCLEGTCSGSLCLKYGMEDCMCESEENLCDLCCQPEGSNGECKSSLMMQQFNYTRIFKHIGSPCDSLEGYCDAFNRCMAIDSNGPLSRLKDVIFNPHLYKGIFEWARGHWWLTALICGGGLVFMILLVKVFSVHTPSSNPRMPKNRHLRDTVGTLPRTLSRHHHSRHSRPPPPIDPYLAMAADNSAAPPATAAPRGGRGGRRRRTNQNVRNGSAAPNAPPPDIPLPHPGVYPLESRNAPPQYIEQPPPYSR